MTSDERPRITATSVTVMTPDPYRSAEFYAALLGVEVATREPAPAGAPEVAGFAQVRLPHLTLNLEYEAQWSPPVWPARAGQQRATQHLDLWVDDLEDAGAWAARCGATPAPTQPQDDVRVWFDPVGHPFCLFL